MTKTYSLNDFTEQFLDGIVEKHSQKWREDYRRRFAAMVADVKATPIPEHKTKSVDISRNKLADQFSAIRKSRGV